MAEFKTAEDLEPKARYLVDRIARHARVGLTSQNVVEVAYTETLLQLVASELLDAYKEGWDDRSTAI